VEFSNTITIDRPSRDVFAFIADFENVPKWNYAILETRKTSTGSVGVGSTYRQVRSLPTRSEELLEVTELDPGRRFTVRGDLGPFTGTMTYEFEDAGGGGTRLTNTAHLEGRGIMKVAAPIASGRVRDAVAENLRALKGILESKDT
jgi:carbon monoxide dehydrogenase subunit G